MATQQKTRAKAPKKVSVRRGRPRAERAAWSGPRVYALMAEIGMTIDGLARAGGVARSTAYKWQSPGVRGCSPTVEQAFAIRLVLGAKLKRTIRPADVAPKKRAG